jgi:hypothetical protein
MARPAAVRQAFALTRENDSKVLESRARQQAVRTPRRVHARSLDPPEIGCFKIIAADVLHANITQATFKFPRADVLHDNITRTTFEFPLTTVLVGWQPFTHRHRLHFAYASTDTGT